MKIVQIEDFFHPDAGYQLNVLSKYFKAFGHEVVIITAEMDLIPNTLTDFFGRDEIEKKDLRYSNKYGVKIIRIPAENYISGRVIFKTSELIKRIKDENPDIVYTHGNDTFTSIQIIRNYKNFTCPIVTDSHMVSIASENKYRNIFRFIYRHFVTPIIEREKIPVIRTVNDSYVMDSFGIPLSLAPYIGFGSDTLLFHPDPVYKMKKRNELGIQNDDFVIVYAGKLGEAKGGKLLASLASTRISAKKRIVFVIVGNTEKNDYGAIVEQMLGNSNNTIRFPTQKYEELAHYYQIGDIAIIPKACSLSIYDMQASGLPVLAEDNSINKERLSCNNGWVFTSGDLDDLVAKVKEIVTMDSEEFDDYRKNALHNVLKNANYSIKAKEYESILVNKVEAYKSKQ